MSPEPIPTLLYIRQSVTRDRSESIPTQVERCTEAADRFEAVIVDTLIEPPSTSGYKDRGRGRPRFLDLLERIRNGEAKAVMAYKSDRLSRGGGPGWAPLIEALEDAGCDTDHAVLTPNGWLTEFEIGIRASMDREESKKLSDRMRDVRAREAREGRPRMSGRPYGYSCSGKRPGACEVPGCRHDGTTSLIPSEVAVIRDVAERVLLGESLWGIANDLNERGVPTARGGQWRTSVLTRILTNPRYAGLRAHNGAVVADGSWEPVFDQATWERLCLALESRPGAGNRRYGARTYPLVGFLFCSKCGGKLRSLQKQGGKRAYSCRKGAGLGGCGSLITLAEPVEEEVRQYVIGKLCDPEYRKQLARLAESADDESESLADQLAEAEAQRDRLLDLYLEQKVTKAAYERRYEALTEGIEALHRKVFAAPEHSVLRDLPPTVEQLAALWDEKGIGFQRQLIDLVIQRVEVLPGQPGRRAFDPGRLVWHPR
jgi:DNA invertase Pin-like site-specific DNA recombinase